MNDLPNPASPDFWAEACTHRPLVVLGASDHPTLFQARLLAVLDGGIVLEHAIPQDEILPFVAAAPYQLHLPSGGCAFPRLEPHGEQVRIAPGPVRRRSPPHLPFPIAGECAFRNPFDGGQTAIARPVLDRWGKHITIGVPRPSRLFSLGHTLTEVTTTLPGGATLSGTARVDHHQSYYELGGRRLWAVGLTYVEASGAEVRDESGEEQVPAE